MKFEVKCTCCSKGCSLTVDDEGLSVAGNSCPRGLEYGVNEAMLPKRIITSEVSVEGGKEKTVPARTRKPIPKELALRALEEMGKAALTAPVRSGDIVVENLLETGVDVIALKDVPAEQ
jgi:CxxC motif-containing protein